jgi:hypothetical protein
VNAKSGDLTTNEVLDLSAWEFDIPCEVQHPKHGDTTPPADWAVFLRQPRVCGCRFKSFLYACDACWTWSQGIKRVRCPRCGWVGLPSAIVLRVERIRT